MLGNLMYQTRKPDQIAVLVSGTDPAVVAELREDFPGVTFHVREDRDDWGHEKRAEGRFIATGDFMGFFNDDDSYDLTYIEKLLNATEDGFYDVAYVGWNSIPYCEFRTHHSTSGNYIVRTSIARRADYEHRVYDSDGKFIESIKEIGAVVAPRVDGVLYFHNHQP